MPVCSLPLLLLVRPRASSRALFSAPLSGGGGGAGALDAFAPTLNPLKAGTGGANPAKAYAQHAAPAPVAAGACEVRSDGEDTWFEDLATGETSWSKIFLGFLAARLGAHERGAARTCGEGVWGRAAEKFGSGRSRVRGFSRCIGAGARAKFARAPRPSSALLHGGGDPPHGGGDGPFFGGGARAALTWQRPRAAWRAHQSRGRPRSSAWSTPPCRQR